MALPVRIGKLDFQEIKDSIKTYLSDQTEFTDYDFEASNINQLINVLAYNAHYNALNANFIVNEMFLDTAVTRGSVVSRAKELGYVPRSRLSSKATLTLTFSNVTNAANIESLIIPRGTRFTSQVGDEIYTYTTQLATSLPRSVENTQYIYRGIIDVYEGILVQHTVTYNTVDPTVNIPNEDVDTSTLKVEIYENGNWQEYSLPSTLLNVTSTSKVYMLQEGFKGFEIYFGDGVFGNTPANSSSIKMTYVVTSGISGNGAATFSLASSISGTTGATTTITSNVSSGGLEKEDVPSIKFNIVNQYGTQNRAVVAADYASLTLQNFAEVKDCLAWDGSDNVPPKFGKVVVCAQPLVGDVLTLSQKSTISTFLQSKGVANTKVDFVDPEYVELIVNSTVRYNTNIISLGAHEIRYVVKVAVSNYAKSTINKFGGKFRYSSAVREIDNSDHSITGNLTSIQLQKTKIPTLYAKNSIRFSFVNEIDPNSFSSNIFYVEDLPDRMYLKDNGEGRINVVYNSLGLEKIYQSGVGSIDYATGIVQIDNLVPVQLDELSLKFTASPVNQDLLSSKNVILNLSLENVNVTVLPDYI